MVFDNQGIEIFCRRYTNKDIAKESHDYYVKVNSK